MKLSVVSSQFSVLEMNRIQVPELKPEEILLMTED